MVKRIYVPSSKDIGVNRHLITPNGLFSVAITTYLKQNTYKEKKCLFDSTILESLSSRSIVPISPALGEGLLMLGCILS